MMGRDCVNNKQTTKAGPVQPAPHTGPVSHRATAVFPPLVFEILVDKLLKHTDRAERERESDLTNKASWVFSRRVLFILPYFEAQQRLRGGKHTCLTDYIDIYLHYRRLMNHMFSHMSLFYSEEIQVQLLDKNQHI